MKRISKEDVVKPLTAEIVGTREMLLCGCTGIIHFSCERMGIRARTVSVWVSGEGLSLCWAGDGKLMIRGKISLVEYKGDV